MLETYRLIWGLLDRLDRRRFLTLMLLSVVMSIFEVMGVAIILPFLSVLAQPALVQTNAVLSTFARVLGLESDQSVVIALGIAVLVAILVGMAVRAFVTYAQIRFSLNRSQAIAARLLRGYLAQDYVWFLTRNSADLGQQLLSEVDSVIRDSILPAILMVSNVFTTLLVLGLLFLIESGVAIGAGVILLVTYGSIHMLLRQRVTRLGKLRLEANRARFHFVQELSGGIKELKVMGLEKESVSRFCVVARALAHYQTLGQVMRQMPRFALEASVYGGFVIMVLVLVLLHGEKIGSLIPLLGVIGMAGTKLFPVLQQLFSQLSQIRFSEASLKRLSASVAAVSKDPVVVSDGPPLRLTREIELRDVSFRYPSSDQPTFEGFSARLPAFATIGVVGGTGAGKTTLIDLLLGLLRPDSGQILIDGTPLGAERIRAWQKSLGYVPQQIFLTDDSVAGNIAFGTAPEKIDMAAVERAARIANLHDFIMTELPQDYQTKVGERGVRLSGGQRQRIGIARALYHVPDVLILDEATSALDNLTERAVMEAVHNLGRQKTVIMIAHRLTTVEDCDLILMLDHGQLVAKGTYQELVAGNDTFRRMAKR
jgi:ABC-type multidrug transport system fused ATPase/permease subunit